MSVITKVPEPKLWDEICKEYKLKRPPFRDDDAESIHTQKEDFNPTQHHPVFFGNHMHHLVTIDCSPTKELDPSQSHPASVGYAFVQRGPVTPPPPPPPSPDKSKCTPRQYLEHYIFPILLPGLEEMLRQAKIEKCFERKRTKFNALDFITEYLYKKNPNYTDRKDMVLWDIPFVKEWLIDHPRSPLPLSLLYTEEEATVTIQAFWRAYKVRLDPEVQDLRQWQKSWREENENINKKVDNFWARQMPDQSTPNASEETLTNEDDKPISVKSPAPNSKPTSAQ